MPTTPYDPLPLLRLLQASLTPVDGSESYRLPNGATLHVSADTYSRHFGRQSNRLILRWYLPRELQEAVPYYKAGTAPKQEMSVSLDKRPDQIAAEFNRRLRPELDRAMTDARQVVAGRAAALKSRFALLQPIAEALGVPVHRPDGDPSGYDASVQFGEYPTLKFCAKVDCESRRTIKLALEDAPADLALAIAHLCRTA